jgi:glutathione S-transferase
MIELYDLVGANDLRFSPFCARTKAVLTHKKLDYSTTTVRFTEKPKIAFSDQDRVPVLKKDDGTIVFDSWTIACDLEEQQPEPKIFPGLGQKEACRFFNLYVDNTVHPALMPVILREVFEKIEPGDRDYFRQSREARFGATLEDIFAKQEASRPQFHKALADLNAAIAGQDYFFGVFSYSDICLFGTLTWVTRISDEPLFDNAPGLQAWWERMNAQFKI